MTLPLSNHWDQTGDNNAAHLAVSIFDTVPIVVAILDFQRVAIGGLNWRATVLSRTGRRIARCLLLAQGELFRRGAPYVGFWGWSNPSRAMAL